MTWGRRQQHETTFEHQVYKNLINKFSISIPIEHLDRGNALTKEL